MYCHKLNSLPYLQEGKTISVDPLLLLTVGQIANPQTSLRTVQVEIPATYLGTGEPILLRCTGVQLGDADACEKEEKDLPQVTTIPTVVLRLHWFRDESWVEWSEVVRRPVRSLVEALPILQICRDKSCETTCQFFHPSVEEQGLDSTLVDMWSWRWCSLDGKKSKSIDADVFQLFIRCPESLLDNLLQRSGENGLYWEPRKNEGLGPHPSYALIWLTGSSLKHAQHIVRSDEHVIGLARLGIRYGLRTLEKDSAVVHSQYCPDKPFLKGNISLVY